MYEEEIYKCIYIVYTCLRILRKPQETKPRIYVLKESLVEDNILFPLLTLLSLFMLISSVRKKKDI